MAWLGQQGIAGGFWRKGSNSAGLRTALKITTRIALRRLRLPSVMSNPE